MRALRELGTVTLATFSSFCPDFDAPYYIEIPDRLRWATGTLAFRISQVRTLSYVLRHTPLEQFDAVFFLCYESISFSLQWRSKCRTFVFNHNNIDKIHQNRLKRFFFRHIDKRVTHVAHLRSAAEYVRQIADRNVYVIPHPYYGDRSFLAARPLAQDASSEPRVIFSPSAGPALQYLDELIHFVQKHKGYRLVSKARTTEHHERYELSTFFDDYEARMAQCDYVFFGGRYEYRASGVVYEALSFGKPVAMLDCQFARDLHKDYPNLAFPIERVEDIGSIRLDPARMQRNHERFLAEHSYEKIRDTLGSLLRSDVRASCP